MKLNRPGVNAAGSAIGCIFCAWAADALSRKKSIQIGAIVLIIGAAICAGSINNGMFVAGRIVRRTLTLCTTLTS